MPQAVDCTGSRRSLGDPVPGRTTGGPGFASSPGVRLENQNPYVVSPGTDISRARDRPSCCRVSDMLRLMSAPRPASTTAPAARQVPSTNNLVVIGEAVNALPASITVQEPDVPWRDMSTCATSCRTNTSGCLRRWCGRTIDEPLEQLRTACQRLHTAIAADQDDADGVTMEAEPVTAIPTKGDAGGA